MVSELQRRGRRLRNQGQPALLAEAHDDGAPVLDEKHRAVEQGEVARQGNGALGARVGRRTQPLAGGILRTEKKTLNQYVVNEDDPLDIRNDLQSPELGYLEFRYFDGVEWDTKWDISDGNSLPQLIMVTVGYKSITQDELDDVDLQTYPLTDYPFGDPKPRDDRYSVIVKIPAADRFFSSRISRIGKQTSDQLGVTGGGLK